MEGQINLYKHISLDDQERLIDICNSISDFCLVHSGLPDYIVEAVQKQVEPGVSAAERRAARKMRRLFAGVERQFIQALSERGVLMGNPTMRTKLVNDILEPAFNKMAQELADMGVDTAELGREQILTQLNNAGISVRFAQGFSEVAKQVLKDRTFKFANQTFQRATGDILRGLVSSMDEGLGIKETSRRLRKEFSDIRNWKVDRLARTEINSAQNEGANMTMDEFKVPYKMWITSQDNRVRAGVEMLGEANHVVLHGQVVSQEERFTNGLLFPGDRSTGQLAEFINCRCRHGVYFPEKGEVITSTPVYRL